jgi:hypothetical protein
MDTQQYRVRLTGERTHYVDVRARDAVDAARVALINRPGFSAQCVGLTAELEARGRARGK